MSKKRNKSPTNNNSGGNKWESNITTAELNENNWSYSLSIIVENIPEDTETINYINKGMSSGLRKKFTLITMDKIIQLINEFGNPKSKKGKEAPLNFEICETGKPLLDKNESLSIAYLAKFIKWIIMTNKIEDLKNIGEVKKTDEKSSKAKKGADKNERVKSSSGKKGSQTTGKRSPEPPSVKQDNKLRKRGDPDPDIPYIDDEPDDGSSRYFVISGIADHQLLEALAEIGCIATSVVRITRDIHISPENSEKINDPQDKVSIMSDKDNDDMENVYEKKLENLKTFWTNLNTALYNNKQLLNTPIVTLVAKHLMFPIEIDNEEQKNKCSMDLYESLAVLMYDLLDLKRQWQNYLSKSKLIGLPVKARTQQNDENTPRESIKDGAQISSSYMEANIDVTFDKLDMDYYNYLMQDVPVESSSIYLQMSAMLDQVEISCGEKIPNWELNKSDIPSDLNEDTVEILRNITNKLYLPKDDLVDLQKSLQISTASSNESRNNEKNVPIHALDGITIRDREIESKNFGKNGVMGHELQMLVASFRHLDLLNSISIDDKITRIRAARLQELLKYLSNTGLSNIEINYAIKIFILENITLSGVDENGLIRLNNEDGFSQKNIHQAWDDPFMVIGEVSRSIIDDEINKMNNETVKLQTSFVESENASSSLKSESYPDGILKSSRLSSRSQSPELIRSARRKSSVHFLDNERVESPTMLTETQFDLTAMLDDQENEGFQEILLDYLMNLRKRNFNEWCFEEFYEPHVLLQIVHQAIYKLPFIDIYNQRRLDSQLVVLHNPFHPDTKYNNQSWNQWLHSNVGFRNYLDFVSDKITDWNREEDAIYQANLLSRELQAVEPEIKEPESKGKPTKANEKGKKPNQTKGRSRSSSRASSVDENSNKELNLILPGSLKALKMEQDKINKAKEEEEMKKEQKRLLSAQKKAEKDQAKAVDKTKDNKRPSSKASNKSKTKKTAFDDSAENFEKENNQEIDFDRVDGKDYWPFISYNLGDNLAHFSGNVAHLFPSDGSTIRIFKMNKLLDTTSIRVSVITTQSHVFTVHIIDPKYSEESQIENYDQVLEQFTKSKSISYYGASTCTFNDGMTIAASNNGYSGTNFKNSSISEVQVDEVHSQRSNDVNGNGNMIGSPGENNQTNEKPSNQKNPFPDHMDSVDYPNIILTTPDGIQVTVGYELTENEINKDLLIFMTKSRPNSKQNNLSDKSSSLIWETGRYVTIDGRIVTVFNNEQIKVLFADGTVAVSQLAIESAVRQDEEIEELKLEKSNVKESPNQKRKTKQSKSISVEPSIPFNPVVLEESKQSVDFFRKWKVTLSNGEVYETTADLNSIYGPKPIIEPVEIKSEDELVNEEIKEVTEINQIPIKKNLFKTHQLIEPLFVSLATDPSTGETLVTRSDGTLLLESQEAGIFLSEHSDGTRFTKYFLIEKLANSINENGEIIKSKINELLLIESKQYPAVTIDLTNGKIETRFGSMGSLLSDISGNHFFRHSDNTEIEYRPDGEIIFTASNNSQMTYLQPDGPCSYVFNPTSNIICEIIDNESTEFIIDVNGNFDVKINKKNDKQIDEPSCDQEIEQNNEKVRPHNSAISMANDTNENVRKFDQHAPRIFSINSDGSGSELLRYRDIVDTLVNSEIDEDYFHCQEEIQDSPQIVAHTILHPNYKSKPWTYDYSRKSVLPKGLTCRDMKTFPSKEEKVPGPPFAINIGKGLEITSNPIMSKQIRKQKKNIRQEQWLNPMQFRQFYHYPIIGNDTRNNFAVQLVEYNKKILQQRQKYKDLEIIDDRSEEEIQLANEVQRKLEALKYNNKEIVFNAVDIFSRFKQPQQQSQDSDCSLNKTKISESVPNKNPNQRKLEIILEQERINKEKEIENMLALKNKMVPKYFTSIYGKDFISNQAMDLQSLNKSMRLFSISRDGTSVNEIEQNNKTINNEIEETQALESDSILQQLQSDDSKLFSGNEQKERKKAFDSTLVIRKKEKKYLYYDSSLFIPNIPKRIPMSSNLILPSYLYSQRPTIEPNIKQALVEDPVRRKMYTTSLIGGSKISQMLQRQTRGLNILPARIDTGLLREGQNYVFKIKLINTGPESSYFKIKQPPSATGIWVEFLPGPIAAGLSRKLSIHVYAIANNLDTNNSNVSLFEHCLQITTNTDKLIVPIVGRVMVAEKYDSIYSTSKSNTNNLSTLSESNSVRSNSNLEVPVLLQ